MKRLFRHSKFMAEFTDEDGYFSLTGEIGGSSGAVGDVIAEIDPRFALLNAMHLSDAKTGEPMHAEANGKYHANNGDADKLAELWRISLEDAKQVCTAVKFDDDERTIDKIIGRAIIKLDLKAKWLKEAKEVRKIADSIPLEMVDGFTYPLNKKGNFISSKYGSTLSYLDKDELKKLIALAKHAGVDVLEIGIDQIENSVLDVSGIEYFVLTDEEADEKATEYIRDSLWAFNAEFLASYTNLPEEMFMAVQDQCEKANDVILRCVESTGSIEDFAQKAISADGRGHFLSRYDGREDEEEVNGITYYIYRQ